MTPNDNGDTTATGGPIELVPFFDDFPASSNQVAPATPRRA
jgi:hypothetical protein